MTMSEARVGESFRIIRVKTGKEVGRRLADMGFTEGTEGVVIRNGFFRGPLQVKIRGYDILIRRSEASDIEIEPIIPIEKNGKYIDLQDVTSLQGKKIQNSSYGQGRG